MPWLRVLVPLALVALCVGAFWLNRDQPLVRNSLVYARAAEHVIAHGFDPRPVVADSRLSYDKPIAFPWLAAPLVQQWGNHTGLMVASACGVLALFVATWQLLRTVLPGTANARIRTWAFGFGLFSPLVVYQTWSAHPDGIETALQLAAFTQAWRLSTEPLVAPRRRAVWLFLCLEACVLFKNYGLVMLLVLPISFGRRSWHAWRTGGRTAVVGVVLAWLAVAGLAVLARCELNPLHRLVGEGGGFDQYGRGDFFESATGCLLALAVTLCLCCHAILPFAWRCRPGANGLWPLLGFAGVHIAGLLPFETAYYNLRYFLPVLPIVGICAAVGLASTARATQQVVVLVFAVSGLVATAVFNVAPLNAAVRPFLPTWRLRGHPLPGMLDSLRMDLHRQQATWLARLHAALPAGAGVWFVDFDYYDDALQGVYEHSGRIRSDIRTHYVRREQLNPDEQTFFVCFGHEADLPLLESLGAVDEPQPGVFRVQRR